LQPPERGGARWFELTSDHFVFYTDVPVDEVRPQIERFEMLRSALGEVGFPGAHARRAAVIVFGDAGDYGMFAPPRSAGLFYPGLPRALERQPTLVVQAARVEQTRRRFVHEMVHELMFGAFGETPPWLNEGLADYFSTMAIESGEIVLGAPVPERAISLSLLPTIDEITHAEHERFSPERSDSLTVSRYYAGAFALVHLLRNGPDVYRERFDVMARALGEGRPFSAAWATAMRDLDAETFERDYRAHAASSDWSFSGKHFECRPAAAGRRARDAPGRGPHVVGEDGS
jgi:hypothetical protein